MSGSPPGSSKETGRRRLRPDAVGDVRPNTAYSNRVLSVFGASGKRCGDYEPEPAEWWMALGRDGTLLTITQDTDCTFRWYPQLFKSGGGVRALLSGRWSLPASLARSR